VDDVQGFGGWEGLQVYGGVCGPTTQGDYELPDVEAESEEQVHESEEARF